MVTSASYAPTTWVYITNSSFSPPSLMEPMTATKAFTEDEAISKALCMQVSWSYGLCIAAFSFVHATNMLLELGFIAGLEICHGSTFLKGLEPRFSLNLG